MQPRAASPREVLWKSGFRLGLQGAPQKEHWGWDQSQPDGEDKMADK